MLWKSLMSRSRPTWAISRSMKAEVAAGDPDDRVDQFTVGMQVLFPKSELQTVVAQDTGDALRVERLVVVRETDSAGELRIAGALPVEPGHADDDDAHVGPVEEVADLFQPVHFKPVDL